MNVKLVNSQHEFISIKEIVSGEFAGQHLLVIEDNDATGVNAIHLLDRPTLDFLIHHLTKLREEESRP